MRRSFSKELLDMETIIVPQALQAMLTQVPFGQRASREWSVPEGIERKVIDVNGEVEVEHIIPNEVGSDIVLFFVHGGGFVLDTSAGYRDTAVFMSKQFNNAEVFIVDYRIVPEVAYPCPLDDVVNAYKWVLSQGYSNDKIVFIGDSAGGNLVLTSVLKLKDEGQPLPKVVCALCPWTEISNTSNSRHENDMKDKMLGKGLGSAGEAFAAVGALLAQSDYMKESEIGNPYVQPTCGNFKNFPSLLIEIGTHERLYDDAITLYNKAKEAQVDVEIIEYEGVSHDFPVLLQMMPIGQCAWDDLKAFVEERIK